MDSHAIERLLRRPAPDEPAVLPALAFPLGAGPARPGFRITLGSAVGRPTQPFPRLAVALLLLGAAIAAVASGAVRLDLLREMFDPNAVFRGGGLSIVYPKDWQRLTPEDPEGTSLAFTELLVSSVGVPGCSLEELGPDPYHGPVESGGVVELPEPDPSTPWYPGPEDRIFACVLETPMAQGEIRVVVSLGYPQVIGVGPMETFDPTAWFGPEASPGDIAAVYVPTEADGWTARIDGMPAKLVIESGPMANGADEIRTWGIYGPNAGTDIWYVRMSLRGPDLEALRTQADAIAASLRFDSKPPLLHPERRDADVARAIDHEDREFRRGGSSLLGCFPRTAGERTVEVTDGPAGELLEPVTLTCATSVEATLLQQWHITLIASWPAADGRPAGRWGMALFVGPGSSIGAAGQLFEPTSVPFPGSDLPLPAPLDRPLELRPGVIVQVLPPGIDQSGDPIQALWQEEGESEVAQHLLTDAQPGRRLTVVDGPLRLVDTDWYLVQSQPGWMYPGEFLWIPVVSDGRPLVAIVEPRCETVDPDAGPVAAATLARLLPHERVVCFGDRELPIDPAWIARDENRIGGITGTPAWLADDTFWLAYGAGGPDGVDGAVPITFDPSLGATPPIGAWLTLRGHFADPGAATCERVFPPEWGAPPETPAQQTMRCGQLFVVTGFATRAAP